MDDLITTQDNAVALPQLELEIKFYLGQTAQNIIEVGKRLIQAKSLVNHGHWQNWLEKNFQLKERSARNFMECAERYGNRQTFANLGYSQMIALLSLPDAEETEKFIAEKAAEQKNVAEMTIKELREAIAEHKKKIAEQDETIAARDKTIADNNKAYQESLFKLDEAHKKEVTDLNDELADVQSELADKKDKLEDAEKELKERPTVTVPPEDYQQTKKDFAAAQIELGKAQAAIENQAKDFERQSKEAQEAFDTERQEFQEKLDKAGKKITKLEKVNERLTRKRDYFTPAALTDENFKLICADIRDGLPDIADNSVDFVITDPPYPKEFLPLYGDLSKVAARVLKDGGSLICMTGQSYLPEVIQLLGTNMTYHWCLSYSTPGGQSVQLFQKKINTFWKPLLWFVKGKYTGDWNGDVLQSPVNANDKRYHKWGQSLGGMTETVLRLTNIGDVILDPFLGGGTTAIAALWNRRKFIGVDVSQKCLDTARARIQEDFNDIQSSSGADRVA